MAITTIHDAIEMLRQHPLPRASLSPVLLESLIDKGLVKTKKGRVYLHPCYLPPMPTEADILAALKYGGTIPRNKIPDKVYQQLCTKGLIVGYKLITLKRPTVGRQTGRTRRGDLSKVY